MFRLSRYAMFALLLGQTAYGLILYTGDNLANRTSPDEQRANVFNAVARICDANGEGSFGSAVHIRGKYLLTANHVANGSHVTFDGIVLFARDTGFVPKRTGEADLKLIKLIADPTLPEIELNTDTEADVGAIGTLVGWGVGRDPNKEDTGSGNTNIWRWGNAGTFAKRWGTNAIRQDSNLIQYPIGGIDYLYEALTTNLDAAENAQADEAGAAIYDSGSGLFANVGGIWKLVGITTAVSQSGASTFSTSDNNQNFFVRISAYANDIEAAIPDSSTYSGWKIDHSLHGANADNTADTDGDGINQLLEFALGGDPNVNDRSILPVHRLVEENGETYLEIILTRPKGLHGINYAPQTTIDLSDWPSDSTGIVDSTPQASDNGDGSETLKYRRSQPVSASDKAFIRIAINESP